MSTGKMRSMAHRIAAEVTAGRRILVILPDGKVDGAKWLDDNRDLAPAYYRKRAFRRCLTAAVMSTFRP